MQTQTARSREIKGVTVMAMRGLGVEVEMEVESPME